MGAQVSEFIAPMDASIDAAANCEQPKRLGHSSPSHSAGQQ